MCVEHEQRGKDPVDTNYSQHPHGAHILHHELFTSMVMPFGALHKKDKLLIAAH